MTSIILLAVFLGTAATIVLIIYLIDRVGRLEALALSVQSTATVRQSVAAPQHTFLGLEGKELWDAMSGSSPEGFNDNDLITLKPRYELLLKKHIEKLFADGVKDSKQGGMAKKPKVPIDIATLRGSFSSWIPQPTAATIYNAGFASANATEEALRDLRANLDNSTGMLYSRTELELQRPFSEELMPHVNNPQAPLLEDAPVAGSSPEDDLLG